MHCSPHPSSSTSRPACTGVNQVLCLQVTDKGVHWHRGVRTLQQPCPGAQGPSGCDSGLIIIESETCRSDPQRAVGRHDLRERKTPVFIMAEATKQDCHFGCLPDLRTQCSGLPPPSPRSTQPLLPPSGHSRELTLDHMKLVCCALCCDVMFSRDLRTC